MGCARSETRDDGPAVSIDLPGVFAGVDGTDDTVCVGDTGTSAGGTPDSILRAADVGGGAATKFVGELEVLEGPLGDKGLVEVGELVSALCALDPALFSVRFGVGGTGTSLSTLLVPFPFERLRVDRRGVAVRTSPWGRVLLVFA